MADQQPPAETKDDELPLDEATGRAFEIIDAAELSDWERERRDAVPFLPPAETQQEEERAHCLNCAESGDPDARRVHPAAECPWRPSTFAAEAQQDDEEHEWQCPSCGATTRARMADAQPSADTETLADQFMSSALDNIGAFDGSNDEARDRAYVRAELVALLNGIR